MSVPTPKKIVLPVIPDDLTGVMGEALYAGSLRATMVSKATDCSVSLSFATATPRDGGRRTYRVPLTDAECVYINVNNSHDSVGVWYVTGKHASTLFPSKDWHTGQITADPVRYWVAERMLLIAAGQADMDTLRYSIMLGTECMRCGKPLDEPESIAANFGPKCRMIVSERYGARHHRRPPTAVQDGQGVNGTAVSRPAVAPEPSDLFTINQGESLDDVYARLT